MLNTERVTDYLAAVRAFADATGQRPQLEQELTRLAEFFTTVTDEVVGETPDGYPIRGRDLESARTHLGKDFAPYSFTFWTEKKTADGQWKERINGGLIYHGHHDNGGDGGSPTFAVSLSPCDGWAIHT
jgi:hypothetical protein